MFLSGTFFQTPPENYHSSEEVDIDVVRDDRSIAVVVQDLTVGQRQNEDSLYTAKSFIPPIYDEEGVVNAYDLIKRVAGVNPFMTPDFQANASVRAFRLFRKLEAKVRRAIELQAAQVLQTGTLDLINKAGATAYALDYKPKSAHFPQVTISWSVSATATPLDDLEALCDIILRNGKVEVTDAVFGRTAWLNFQKSAQIQNIADNRRFNLVQVERPQTRGAGGKFHGVLSAGQYNINLWSYNDYYDLPTDGTITPYIDPNKVILTGPGRRDISFGAIPLLRGPEERALPFLPPRIMDGGLSMDLTTNAWFTPNGKSLIVSAGTRPLAIPTAIDNHGCINTVAA